MPLFTSNPQPPFFLTKISLGRIDGSVVLGWIGVSTFLPSVFLLKQDTFVFLHIVF